MMLPATRVALVLAALALAPRPVSATLTCHVGAARSSDESFPSWQVESRAPGACRSVCSGFGNQNCHSFCTTVTVTDTNDRIAYTYVSLRSDSCAADAAAMTALLGTGEAFRCSSELACDPDAEPRHGPDPDISLCGGDGQQGAAGLEFLTAPANTSCEAVAEALDRQARALPGSAELGSNRLDFYCDGYLPLLQLRDCNPGVAVVNDVIESMDTTNISTTSPTVAPTVAPTSTPRDMPAEFDALQAEVVALRAQVAELEDAAAAASASASSNGDTADGGGNGTAAIGLALVAIALAAAAVAIVLRKQREMTATLQAQMDFLPTGGMVDNPMFPRQAARTGDTHVVADTGRGNPLGDGYLAVGADDPRVNLQPDFGPPVVYDTVDAGGGNSGSSSGTDGQSRATYEALRTGGGQQYGATRAIPQQGGAYNRLGEA